MNRLLGFAGILAISFSAIFVRLADVSPTTAAFFRVAYALPILIVATRLRPDRRSSRERLLAAGAGLIFAVDLTLWFASIGDIGAGLATLVVSSQVLWVGLLAWVVLRERPRASAFVVVPVALLGIALISGLGREDAYGDNPVRGVVLSLLAGITYALFILIFRSASKQHGSPAGPLLDLTAGATVGLLLLSRFDGDFSLAITWPAHGWLVLLAVLGQSLGWLLISVVLTRLPALETSIMLLLQPAATMLWAQLVFAEQLSPMQWVGAGIVLIAIIGAALAGSTRIRRASLEAPEP
ncbi:MAG: EamA family transporter [Acidimicrobiia bacterium]|nr:EamA family transporter [Acidimicrobiia bacterium]